METVHFDLECRKCNMIERYCFDVNSSNSHLFFDEGNIKPREEVTMSLIDHMQNHDWKCEFCGGNYGFFVWNIKIDNKEIFSTQAVVTVYGDSTIVEYENKIIIDTLSKAIKSSDFRLTEIIKDGRPFDSLFVYKVYLKMCLEFLHEFYSVDLLDYSESEQYLIDHFNWFHSVNVQIEDLGEYPINVIMDSILISTELSEIADGYSEVEDMLKKIYGSFASEEETQRVKDFFRYEYAKGFKYVLSRFNQIFLKQGVEKNEIQSLDMENEISDMIESFKNKY